MQEGLWTVQFQGPNGWGGGAVVLTKGQALGGDAGFTYIGTYEVTGDTIRGRIAVKNYDPSVQSVLGVRGDFELLLEGKVQGDSITGMGTMANSPNARIAMRLTKRENLR